MPDVEDDRMTERIITLHRTPPPMSFPDLDEPRMTTQELDERIARRRDEEPEPRPPFDWGQLFEDAGVVLAVVGVFAVLVLLAAVLAESA